MRHTLWIGLLTSTAAFSAEPRVATAETVSTVQTDAYAFVLSTCEGVRAEVKDTRPMSERSATIVVDLQSQAPTPCTWHTLALKGWTVGTYTSNRKNPDNDGFTLAPGESVRLHINLSDPAAPREGVRLEIAPGRGTVLLIGVVPPPPTITTPVTTPP